MASENQPDLSESEREVLRVLWDRGPDTVREINAELTRRGRRWAYTTVATLLQRLCAKQYAASNPSTIPHVFRAAVTRDDVLERGSRTRPTSCAMAGRRRWYWPWCREAASRPRSWRECADCWTRRRPADFRGRRNRRRNPGRSQTRNRIISEL